MIRLVHLMKRKAGTSHADFAAYWRDEHGPRVAAHQTRLGILRYTQLHRDPGAEQADAEVSRARGGLEPPFDGVAETWWKSEEALVAAVTTDSGRAAADELLADENRFIDLAYSPMWFAHEYPQVSMLRERPVARPKTGVLKTHFALRQLPELSVEEAQRYWLTMHGPLVRAHAVARGVIAYYQVHRYDSPLIADMRTARGTQVEPYMGHAEAWIDRLTSRAGPEITAAAAAALEDERHFIDWSRSTIFSGKELVFIDRDWL